MFTRNRESDPPRRSLPPLPYATFALGAAFIIPFVARQPREAAVAVYSAYAALMAFAAGVIFLKKHQRGRAIGAAVACAAFMGLFVLQAYWAYVLP